MAKKDQGWPYSQKVMDRNGVPDFKKFAENMPQLEELEHALAPETFKKIKLCCMRKLGDLGGCLDPLCTNCVTRKRYSLIKEGSRYCYDLRLRACLFTAAKAEWEAELDDLNSIKPSAIVREVLDAVRDVDHFSKGALFVIGSLDISMNELPGEKKKMTPAKRKLNHVWGPHVHMVLIGHDPERLAQAIKYELQGVQIPNVTHFKIDKSYCVGRTISYATSLEPERRELVVDARQNAQRKPRPLAAPRMREALQWLGRTKADQRIFTYYKPQ